MSEFDRDATVRSQANAHRVPRDVAERAVDRAIQKWGKPRHDLNRPVTGVILVGIFCIIAKFVISVVVSERIAEEAINGTVIGVLVIGVGLSMYFYQIRANRGYYHELITKIYEYKKLNSENGNGDL